MFSQTSLTIDQVPVTIIRQQNALVYQRVQSQAQMVKVWAKLTWQSAHLLELGQVLAGKSVRSRRAVGMRTVRVAQIVGSESRSSDFDRSFRPLKAHSKQRWVSVATAFSLGIGLPAVDLILVGDEYFVRDGHHRVSVARALGYEYIEAYVTEWQVNE